MGFSFPKPNPDGLERTVNCQNCPTPADKLVDSMAISERLLEILVCPLCKAKVVLKEDGSGLKCVACHRVYPVRDDIPIMMVDQATIEA